MSSDNDTQVSPEAMGWLALAAGGALFFYGVTRKHSILGKVLTFVGMGLVKHGATEARVLERVGLGTMPRRNAAAQRILATGQPVPWIQ